MNLTLKATPSYYEHVILNFLDEHSFKVFYDIGVGPKSEYLTLNNKFPSARFYGLEPNPSIYKDIESKFPGTVLPMAVSESGETVRYVVHEQNVMASGLIPYDNAAGGEEIFVPSITLDNFDKRFGSPDGILLWMDIEGYELKALSSGSALIRSGRVKLINLEVRPRWNEKSEGCTESEIDNHLAKFGYKKIFVYNHYPQSRHHDAIYLLEGYTLPIKSAPYLKLYSDITRSMSSPDGVIDLALGIVDCAISLEEKDAKIGYLRGRLSQFEQSSAPIAGHTAKIIERDSNVGPVLCRQSTRMDKCLARSKYHDLGVEYFIKKYRKHLFPFVDIGANIGLFSILSANLSSKFDQIYSFEPDNNNRSLLKANVAIRDIGNIVIEKYAVSEDDGYISVGKIDCGVAKKSNVDPVNIQCRSIDSYFEDKLAPRFIKIDIEGAEIDVIKGMKGLIKRAPPIVQMEFSYRDLKPALIDLWQLMVFDTYIIEFLLGPDSESFVGRFNDFRYPIGLITHTPTSKEYYSVVLSSKSELDVMLNYLVEATTLSHSAKWEVCFTPKTVFSENANRTYEDYVLVSPL
jgi:FkbM family methyltransferase